MNATFADSGSRRDFGTGAVRDMSDCKGRMDLMPANALIEVSKIYEIGCQKYGDRNWEKGIPVSQYLSSGLRHAMKAASGMTDEPHLAMAAWNLLCAIATDAWVKEGRLPPELAHDLPVITVDDWRSGLERSQETPAGTREDILEEMSLDGGPD